MLCIVAAYSVPLELGYVLYFVLYTTCLVPVTTTAAFHCVVV